MIKRFLSNRKNTVKQLIQSLVEWTGKVTYSVYTVNGNRLLLSEGLKFQKGNNYSIGSNHTSLLQK